MPQASSNRKAMAESVLIRKGSIQSRLTDTSFAIQKRALKVNETEHKRLELMLRVMDKHGRAQENKRQRTMGRINKNLKQLHAYRSVLNEDFNADSFDTLRFGYKAKEARKDPQRFQRLVYETRIYHAGYSIRNLRRHVESRLEAEDPEAKQRQARIERLEAAREQHLALTRSIDRKSSLTMILDNHRTKRVDKLPPITQSIEEWVEADGEGQESSEAHKNFISTTQTLQDSHRYKKVDKLPPIKQTAGEDLGGDEGGG